MSSTTTSSGAVLGAATLGGALMSTFSNWYVVLGCAVLILLVGFIIIFLSRKRKREQK